MLNAARLLILAPLGAATLALARQPHLRPLLLWNATASAPVGFYHVQPDSRPKVGDLVVVRPDAALAGWMVKRRYIGQDVPLVKRVAAVAGARVCRLGAEVSIDGRHAATALLRDHLGRELPVWSGCQSLGAHQLFLLNAVSSSLDGRYFGPTPGSAVVGHAAPLWLPPRR